MAFAPPTISSAGWKRTFSVPSKSLSAIAAKTPMPMVAWASWPQACIAPVSERKPSAAGTWSASSDSRRGSASMSTRRPTVGPSPCSTTASAPVSPPSVRSRTSSRAPASRAASCHRAISSSSGTPIRSSATSISPPTYSSSTPRASSSSTMRLVVQNSRQAGSGWRWRSRRSVTRRSLDTLMEKGTGGGA